MNSDKLLGLGKLSKELLASLVYPYIKLYKKPALDANIIEKNTVVSHNLAVGVPLQTLGFYAFHYAVTNVAMRFAKPKYIATGIYLPQGTSKKELETIARELGEETRKYNVKVIAGHTGVYKGVSSPLVSVTCLGKLLRKPRKSSLKDFVLVVGDVGKESVWLKALEKNIDQDRNIEPLLRLTSLPIVNALIRVKDVKLMHDVSEGGVTGAVFEIAENLPFRLVVNSCKILIDEDVKNLGVDPLKVPSYGAVIIIVGEKSLEKVLSVSKELGYSCSIAGSLERGKGAFIDGNKVKGIERTRIDEIYGSFKDIRRD